MYSIVAEDDSDVNCLKVLIKRLIDKPSFKSRGKGYDGSGKLLQDGWKEFKAADQLGFTRFIVCYDQDNSAKQARYEEVISKIIKPSGVKKEKNKICILIPKQEMEAWILADIEAVTKIIPSWKPSERFSSPELVESPKEKLEKLSRIKSSKPLYVHATHNQQVFEHIDLEILKKKCPSFAELHEFVKNDIANYPKNIL